MAKTAKVKTKKKELWTDKDRQGLAEKKGLDMGSLLTNEDKKKGLGEKETGLFTQKDKEQGLL